MGFTGLGTASVVWLEFLGCLLRFRAPGFSAFSLENIIRQPLQCRTIVSY